MNTNKDRTLWLLAAAITAAAIACGSFTETQDDAPFQTQMALSVQQTVVARDIQQLTAEAAPQAAPQDNQPPAEQPPNDPPEQPGDDQPAPAQPAEPAFTASEDMFCRAGPGVDYLDHWVAYAGQTYPVVAKWFNNDWIVVQLDEPGTRTKCCWVGGRGELNVSRTSLPTLNYLLDRMTCEKPVNQVEVWRFDTEKWAFLSCGQITQSTWYNCGLIPDQFCSDANYDNQVDYMSYRSAMQAACSLPDSFFDP